MEAAAAAHISINISSPVGARISTRVGAEIFTNISPRAGIKVFTNIFSNVGAEIFTSLFSSVGAEIFINIFPHVGAEIFSRSRAKERQISRFDYSGRRRASKRFARHVLRGAFRRPGPPRNRHYGPARNPGAGGRRRRDRQ